MPDGLSQTLDYCASPAGILAHFHADSMRTLRRNGRALSHGIAAHFRPEYAL
jgi:hypothetical protein